MSGSKGIKEKWIVESGINNGLITISSKTAYICDVDAHEGGEYNALLISKAPEMLEMLESVAAMFAKGQIITVDNVVKKREEIKQLIKEATRI